VNTGPALPKATPPAGPKAAPRRAWVLGLWLLALLLCGWQIARTPFVADLSAFLPSDAESGQQVLIEQIRSGAPARSLFIGIDGGTAATRAEASRSLAAALRASPRFEQVANGETDAWADIGRWLVERRYLLSPAVTPERFTAEGLREAINETLSLLGTPAGAAASALLEQDPTGEVQRIAETLIPPTAPRNEQGVWVARSDERALLLAMLSGEGTDLDFQAAALAEIDAAFAPFAARGLELRVSGSPVFAVESRAAIETEINRLALAGVLVVGTLLLLAFASPTALGVALLPVGTGVAAGVAAVGLGFGNVHGMTLGFGVTLIGEAVDYAIYYLVQAGHRDADATNPSQTGWRRWLARGWPTLRLGLLTSVCGFAALLFSGFPGLRQLGVFSVAGLVAALLTTRYLLPVLLPQGARRQGLRRPLGHAGRWLFATLPRTRTLWLLLALAAVLVLATRERLWETELATLSPVSAASVAQHTELQAQVGAGDGGTRLVVVQGPDAETTLQRAEAAAVRLEALVNEGTLAGFDSVTRLLPSLKTQAARQAALPDAAPLVAALAQATAGGPLPAARLAPFLEAVQAARSQAPITPEAARASPAGPLVGALLLEASDGSWMALLPLQPAEDQLDSAALNQAIAGLEGTLWLDVGAELSGLYTQYLGEARQQALVGAAGVLLLLALSLGGPNWLGLKRAAAVAWPLLLAVLLWMGVLAAAGIAFGILHLVGFLLVVAVGSNYVLFFAAAQDGEDLERESSLLFANLTTVAGFALIATSTIPALAAIGQVVGPGALLALVLAAAFARPAAATTPSSAAR
jgi:predicted exporter